MLISSQQKNRQAVLKVLRTDSEAGLLAVRNDDRKAYTDDCERPTQEIGLGRDNDAGSTILIPGQTLQGTGFEALDGRDLAVRFSIISNVDHVPPISLSTEDVTRYKMAWRAFEFYQQSVHFAYKRHHGATGSSRSSYIPSALVQRCTDWPSTGDVFAGPIALGFTMAGLIYGGLHALAWFAHFESSTQQLLWRISACVVMGGFPVFWVLCEFGDYIDPYVIGRFNLDYILVILVYTALALVALAYMLARAYLVVECFINLSHLPAGVYDVPSWSSYFPHIS